MTIKDLERHCGEKFKSLNTTFGHRGLYYSSDYTVDAEAELIKILSEELKNAGIPFYALIDKRKK